MILKIFHRIYLHPTEYKAFKLLSLLSYNLALVYLRAFFILMRNENL